MVRRDLYEQVIEGDPYLHQSGKFLMGDVQLWAELAINIGSRIYSGVFSDISHSR